MTLQRTLRQVHEFHVWQLSSSALVCSAHVVMRTESCDEVNHTVDLIKQLLHRNNIHASTIQTEIHSAECALCEPGAACAGGAPLLLAYACSDFVCGDAECWDEDKSFRPAHPAVDLN